MLATAAQSWNVVPVVVSVMNKAFRMYQFFVFQNLQIILSHWPLWSREAVHRPLVLNSQSHSAVSVSPAFVGLKLRWRASLRNIADWCPAAHHCQVILKSWRMNCQTLAVSRASVTPAASKIRSSKSSWSPSLMEFIARIKLGMLSSFSTSSPSSCKLKSDGESRRSCKP